MRPSWFTNSTCLCQSTLKTISASFKLAPDLGAHSFTHPISSTLKAITKSHRLVFDYPCPRQHPSHQVEIGRQCNSCCFLQRNGLSRVSLPIQPLLIPETKPLRSDPSIDRAGRREHFTSTSTSNPTPTITINPPLHQQKTTSRTSPQHPHKSPLTSFALKRPASFRGFSSTRNSITAVCSAKCTTFPALDRNKAALKRGVSMWLLGFPACK